MYPFANHTSQLQQLEIQILPWENNVTGGTSSFPTGISKLTRKKEVLPPESRDIYIHEELKTGEERKKIPTAGSHFVSTAVHIPWEQ
jgi:hypothetical protein